MNYRIGLRRSLQGADVEATAGIDHRPMPQLSGNPATGPAHLLLSLQEGGFLFVSVYDVQGREVRQLVDGAAAAGSLEPAWDGRDSRGSEAAPGVYLIRATTGGAGSTVRLIRL